MVGVIPAFAIIPLAISIPAQIRPIAVAIRMMADETACKRSYRARANSNPQAAEVAGSDERGMAEPILLITLSQQDSEWGNEMTTGGDERFTRLRKETPGKEDPGVSITSVLRGY